MNVSEYIFEFFAKKAVDTVFMITGGQAMFLNDAVGRNAAYKIIFNHHEQAATMSADAYGRIKNKPAIAMVTAGPGAVNAINGVVGGYTDSAPMIVISGQSGLQFVRYQDETGIRQHGIQGINIKPLVQNVTKYFKTIDDPEMLNIYLEDAYESATTGRPGPVWIDVPLDIQRMPVDLSALKKRIARTATVNLTPVEHAVSKTYELLKTAKRPIILAGQGVRLSGGGDLFRKFVEMAKIPVLTARLGIDLIESDNHLYVGRPGNYGERSANFAVQNADLIIAAGCRLASALVGHDARNFGRNAFKLVVDIDQKELDKPGVKIDYKANIDCKDYFRVLTERFAADRMGKYDEWIAICNNWKTRYPVVLEEYKQQKPVNSYYFIDRLSQIATAEAAVLVDTGSCFHVACQVWKVKQGQNFLTTGGLSSMGYWAASIGACMANGGGETICITGDGSLQFNIQEFATIRQNKLPIKVFILNNNGYLLIRHTQSNFMDGRLLGEGPSSGLWCPDSLEIAKAYGIKGIRIDSVAGVDAGIREALAHKGPVVCDVMTPEWQLLIPRVSSEKLADGTLVSRPYEDMFPFLPREEFLSNMIVKPDRDT
jgi:acetolactate synthase-1/2/3 large subunit